MPSDPRSLSLLNMADCHPPLIVAPTMAIDLPSGNGAAEMNMAITFSLSIKVQDNNGLLFILFSLEPSSK